MWYFVDVFLWCESLLSHSTMLYCLFMIEFPHFRGNVCCYWNNFNNYFSSSSQKNMTSTNHIWVTYPPLTLRNTKEYHHFPHEKTPPVWDPLLKQVVARAPAKVTVKALQGIGETETGVKVVRCGWIPVRIQVLTFLGAFRIFLNIWWMYIICIYIYLHNILYIIFFNLI